MIGPRIGRIRISTRYTAIFTPEPPRRSRSTTAATQRMQMGTTINSENITCRKVEVASSGVMSRACQRRRRPAMVRPRARRWCVPTAAGVPRALVDASLRKEHERRLHALAHILRVGEPELEEDRVDVLLDGALGQEQRLGDRRVALALGDLAEHLALANCELVERRAVRDASRVHEFLDDLGVDHGAA